MIRATLKCRKPDKNQYILFLLGIPSAKSVPGINQIAKINGLEAAEAKYDVFWGVANDKLQKFSVRNPGIFQMKFLEFGIPLAEDYETKILGVHTRNCDRDLTRFPKAISLMSL